MQNDKLPQLGVYQNRFLAKKVYDAAILVMVLGQEGAWFPQKASQSPHFTSLALRRGSSGAKMDKNGNKKNFAEKIQKLF